MIKLQDQKSTREYSRHDSLQQLLPGALRCVLSAEAVLFLAGEYRVSLSVGMEA
jgi:hypothetical protein